MTIFINEPRIFFQIYCEIKNPKWCQVLFTEMVVYKQPWFDFDDLRLV